ncbi:MAG: flagellar motor protein [Bdellovibrionales bacterium]
MTTWIGLLIGIGGILLGNIMEGGHVSALLQAAAAFVVFGGTFGAMMVSNRSEDLRRGMKLLRLAFTKESSEFKKGIAAQIVEAAQLARRESILALEGRINTFATPHMRSVFRFLIDGVEPETLKQIFLNEVQQEERRQMAAARIWMDAGGFAPTIGIIGAVLGLIHVMANLTDTSALGQGIAVAFVATIYGVGAANLIFIPLANKMQRQIKEESNLKHMVIDGAVAIISGLNPYIIQEKLAAYLDGPQS